MKLIISLVLFINIGFWCRAQVFDDFSDGDFKENPVWLGNDSLFIVSDSKQLQLDAESSGNAYLSTTYIKDIEIEWHFWIKENFSPSTNNYCDVFLISDDQNLSTANQAYILRFGESGSNDVIRLLYYDNGCIKTICSGSDTFIASSFSTFVKVTYDESDLWKIYIDKNGSGIYELESEGTGYDIKNFNDTIYFGFKCNYTNSNIKRFYFDDIYIGKKIIDSIPPQLISCDIVDDYHIELKFSEAIEDDSALNTENYIIEDLHIHPSNIYYGNDYSTVILEFEEAIKEEIYFTLSIEKIEDYEGNVSEKIKHTFLYYKVKKYDIVLNEIMADPSPPIELPEWEYIELYNVSDYPINLNEWKLTIGNSEYLFDESIEIQAKEYLILCDENAIDEFLVFGLCKDFSSFKVSNTGVNIALFDNKESLISSVDFDVSWHSSSYKEDGGWSLEQIDYDNPCAGKPNWSSSVCGDGGTPGECNSINNNNIIRPDIDYIYPLSNNSIAIHFNQNMNMESLLNTENYFIKEMQTNPKEINTITYKNDYIELIFGQEFQESNLYTLSINNIRNCKDISNENEIETTFGTPVKAEHNDIIINEVLFNPITPGVDYLEIYNRSNKVIDLSKLLIGTIKESFPNPPDTIAKEICSHSRIILPNSYILLSSDNDIVIEQYLNTESQLPISRSQIFIEMVSFPSFSNDEGKIFICNKSREIIDEVYYSDKMHYDLLVETKGVSLERISFDNPSLDKTNWHSASYNVNYGTPGYINSVAVNDIKTTEYEEICIIPEIFSPDGDGFDDICAINYNLNNNGYSLNIKIFNSKGILIKNILENTLVSHSGYAIWDGCNDNNNAVNPGIYIVQVEIFDREGYLKRIKECVVVGTK